jgi:hypothetical protein
MDTLPPIQHFVDTINVVVQKPVTILNASDQGANYWGILSSIIALASITIIIYDRLKRLKVFGKIISLNYTNDFLLTYIGYDLQEKSVSGQSFTLKISLGVYNKDLTFKDLDVYAIFQQNQMLKGEIYWIDEEDLVLDDKPYVSKIPAADFLSYHHLIEKGRIRFFYLCFVLPNKTDPEILQQVRLDFIKLNGGKVSVILNRIDEKQIFFDKTLVVPK